MPGREGSVGGRWGAAVPRAHILADVAPEDVRPHGGAFPFRNAAAQFDGEVRDAQARIEGVSRASFGRHDGLRGTCVDAARARAAAVRRRRIRRDFERDQQFPQKEPRAAALVDQAGVAADPSESRRARIRALQQRRRIHAGAPFEIAGTLAQQGPPAAPAPRAAPGDNRRPRHSARSRPARAPRTRWSTATACCTACPRRLRSAPMAAGCADRRAPPPAGR